MESLIGQLQQWEFYQTLPECVHGFHLERNIVEQDTRLYLFWYRCPAKRLAFYGFYDKTTKEFMAHRVIGLFDYCDIQFITPDLSTFEQMLKGHLHESLENLAVFEKSKLGSVFLAKKILEQDWKTTLPAEVCGFSLFIRPERSVKIINGSFIIIDYCDFATESNLTIYYNLYRDEFFSERRIYRLPEIVTDFDAKELTVLIEKLTNRLVPVLTDMRTLLSQTIRKEDL